jgi:hypothetical protein
MPRRKSNEEPDPDDFRLGGSDVGSIVQLSDKNPPGEPFKPKRYPLGFDLRPGVHKKRHRRWRKVRAIK